MEALNNPFVTYGYKGPKYFCDRDKETAIILDALRNERNVALISPRRLGKTGLIHHVFNTMASDDVTCIYIDLLPTTNLASLVQLLAKNIIGHLDTPSAAAIKSIADFFKSLRPTMTFDAVSGMPDFSLDMTREQGEQSIAMIMEYIKRSGRRCYIALDEFQQVTRYPEGGVEALLRSHIQFVANAVFIFSGSEYHMMTEMFLSAARPFYLAAQTVTIAEIPLDTYREFAASKFAPHGQHLDDNAFGFLYRLVDGQTWYVQSILNRLYAAAVEVIDVATVESTVDALLDEMSSTFIQLCTLLTPNQAAVLRAIAAEGTVQEPTAAAFIKRHALPAGSSVRMALESLVTKQLVQRATGGYTTYDRFLALWLRRRI